MYSNFRRSLGRWRNRWARCLKRPCSMFPWWCGTSLGRQCPKFAALPFCRPSRGCGPWSLPRLSQHSFTWIFLLRKRGWDWSCRLRCPRLLSVWQGCPRSISPSLYILHNYGRIHSEKWRMDKKWSFSRHLSNDEWFVSFLMIFLMCWVLKINADPPNPFFSLSLRRRAAVHFRVALFCR